MKKEKIINAAVYVRTATKNNKSKIRIRRQLSEIKKYANKNGYKISEVYTDKGFSGNAPDRPALRQLHEDAKLDKWNIVLIHDISRLARSSVIYKQIENNLQKNGVKIISITGPNDLLTLDISSIFNDCYKKNLSECIKAGIARRKQQK